MPRKKTSQLVPDVRQLCEDYTELLVAQILETNKRDVKTVEKIREAMKKVFDSEFGKDKKGGLWILGE